MTLPIVWAGQAVDNANLQDATGGPWSRVVDVSLASSSGRQYTTLQAAWNAASIGDSIFIKSGTYTGGLTVSTGAGNAKNGIRLVGESFGNASNTPVFNSTIDIADCDDLSMENLTVAGATGNGFTFDTINRYNLDNLHSRSNSVDGFTQIAMTNGNTYRCNASGNTSRGWVVYDGMQHNTWVSCKSVGNGNHGFSIGAFPTVNTWCVFNVFVACEATGALGSGNGFNFTLGSPTSGAKGWQHLGLIGCDANQNAGDGFDMTDISASVNAAGLRLHGCNAYGNGSFGYRLAGAPASWPEFSFVGNQHGSNTGGGYTGFPATLLTGYRGNGLTAPGTNR